MSRLILLQFMIPAQSWRAPVGRVRAARHRREEIGASSVPCDRLGRFSAERSAQQTRNQSGSEAYAEAHDARVSHARATHRSGE